MALLLDELAHTNAPGSRHPKRWQDARELVEAGTSVWTTLNVQHLESVNDLVQRITGIVVNGKLAAPRAEVERLRAVLHNCRRYGTTSQNRDDHPDFPALVLGTYLLGGTSSGRLPARVRALRESGRMPVPAGSGESARGLGSAFGPNQRINNPAGDVFPDAGQSS